MHVSLLRGEKIYCESNAMVMMESALELKGKMTGGLVAPWCVALPMGESFFHNILKADARWWRLFFIADIGPVPSVLEVGTNQLQDNWCAFVAAESGC